MSRWYQHVFTGEKVEVKTLDDDDRYAAETVWSRIPAPPGKEKSAAAVRLAEEKENNEEASEAGRELQAAKKPATKKKAE